LVLADQFCDIKTLFFTVKRRIIDSQK
jgi:hypothetical protein